MKTLNPAVQTLLTKRLQEAALPEGRKKNVLQEAVAGTITAEKVPSGGSATPPGSGGAGAAAGEGGEGHEGPVNKVLTIDCHPDDAEAVVQALKALKTAGAQLKCSCDGEECDLSDEEPKEGEHEAHEGHEHEGGKSGEEHKTEDPGDHEYR
jgi:hypothetical protein